MVASYRDWKRGKPASTSADRKRAVRSYNIVVNALLDGEDIGLDEFFQLAVVELDSQAGEIQGFVGWAGLDRQR